MMEDSDSGLNVISGQISGTTRLIEDAFHNSGRKDA